jgi:hypothetical protein
MRGLFWLILFLLACSSFALADSTFVTPGAVSGHWTSANSPYIIQGHINVPTGDSLIIGPGVRVYFTGPYRLQVDSAAQFDALGMEGDSVVFTTDTLANPERWKGFRIWRAGPDTVRLHYCVLEFMGLDSTMDPPHDIINRNVQLYHSAFRLNRVTQAVFSFQDCQVRVDSCRFTDNWSWDTGALLAWGGTMQIAGCTFMNNVGLSTGAVSVEDDSVVSVSGSRFTANGYGCCGGACHCRLGESITFFRCSFEENVSTVSASALELWGWDSLRIEDCVFRGNGSPEGETPSTGSAVALMFGPAEISNCEFEHNRAVRGGALYTFISDLFVDNCRFRDNEASEYGGVFSGVANAVWTRCIMDSNQASYGGAFMATGGNWRVENSTLLNNYASIQGSAMTAQDGDVELQILFRNNLVANSTGATALDFPRMSGDSLHHNLFFSNSGGNFSQGSLGLDSNLIVNTNGDSCDAFYNLYLDPRFVDLAGGDYRLLNTSPCIDAGDPASSRDPDSTLPDIGAYYLPHHGRHAPAPFHLISPADGFVFSPFVTFIWHGTTDADSINWPEPVDYRLHLVTADTAITIATGTDTTATIFGEMYNLPFIIWADWYVEAHSAHPDTITASLDTFHIVWERPDAADPLILLPSSFSLSVYSNPFNATATLTYDIPQTGEVSLKLYNLLGEEVATLVNCRISAGRSRVSWNAAAASSGTYFAVLQSGEHRLIQKLLLLK